MKEPDERFVRTLMDMAGVEGRRMPGLLEEHTQYIREAMNTFFDMKLLERMGFADRTDIVKVPPSEAATPPPAQEPPRDMAAPSAIVTTEAEMEVVPKISGGPTTAAEQGHPAQDVEKDGNEDEH